MRVERNSMSDQPEDDPVQRTVVLEVPKTHVKTVKSALEKFGKLDRLSRITPGTTKDQIAPEVPEKQSQDVQDGLVSHPFQCSIATSASHRDPEATIQFPVLKFDAVSGQYVQPTILQHQRRSTAADDEQSVYSPTSTLDESHQDLETTLEFDVVSGEYVEPAVRQQQGRSSIIGSAVDDEQRMRIPTTIPYPLDRVVVDDTSQDNHDPELKSKILGNLGLGYLFQDISISHQLIPTRSVTPPSKQKPLQRALREALEALPQPSLVSRGLTVEALVSSFPDSYSVYRPMLLLPHNAFASNAWKTFLSAHAAHPNPLQRVWQRIAEAVGATHIAVNSPIPLQTSTESATTQRLVESQIHENFLRSPVNLTPVFGDFGPSPTPQTLSSPTDADFKKALWVTTTQNGIHQTWAPLYTMFSRGNISEKTRVLNFPPETMDFDVPSTAVDLYAGIGYFAFSYKKAGARRNNGVSKVLCWDLNPWSVEGLRRGAEMNKWTYKIWDEKEMPDSEVDWEAWTRELVGRGKEKGNSEDFWIFQMSNNSTCEFIQHLNTPDPPLIPPVRHINLGLLPSSASSWHTAVRVLDVERGGWIHAHENVGVKDIESRTREVEMDFQGLLDKWDEERMGMGPGKERRRRVRVGHVERVKMYAPGVVHCVFDIYVEAIS